MPPNAPKTLLQLETIDGVMVVNFLATSITDEVTVTMIRDELQAVVSKGTTRFLLNMGNVKKATTHLFAQAAVLHLRLAKLGGGVKICCLEPYLTDAIKIMKLPLEVYAVEQDGLDAFDC